MGNQSLETRADGIKEEPKAFYSIILFPGSHLPDQYKNMVYSKWMRSLKYGNEYFKLIESDRYYEAYQKYINHLLNRPLAIIRLAVLSDDKDVVLGWSLIENDVLHYVHVQHEQRNKGIAKTLVPGKINSITHLTKAGMAIWNSKLPHATFNPFL